MVAHWEDDKFVMSKSERIVTLMTLQLPDDFPEVAALNQAFTEAYGHKEKQLKEELDRHEQAKRKIEEEFEAAQVRIRHVFLKHSRELILPALENNPEVQNYIDMIDEALDEA